MGLLKELEKVLAEQIFDLKANEIFQLVERNIIQLSFGKYSSTVVETFIEQNDLFLHNYIMTIVNSNQVGNIMKDVYGNYTIQKALKIAKGNDLNVLILKYSY